MTPVGHLVLGVTSIVIVTYLMVKSILDTKKGGSGSDFLLLIPVILFLANTI